jgi:UDP-N-acetylglucosamine 2-epimerase (non-hydrolysing)
MKKTIMVVFGTRPEAIKMAPVALALRDDPAFEVIVCVTAQHRNMLDQVMSIFNLDADIDLDIMKPGQDLYEITNRVLMGMGQALKMKRPDLVLVHGDTTTCFATALAAFYQGIPIGHIEAGLRTGNLHAPFPEEGNRCLVGRLAWLHFAPTRQAAKNLSVENVPADNIHITGNTVIDSLLLAREKIKNQSSSLPDSALGRSLLEEILARPKRLILITGHRRENFGQGFIDLCAAIKKLATTHPDWLFIYPVHLNPNVQKPVHMSLGNSPNVKLIAPLDYLPFVWLMDRCDLILTDSGGIQEEGPALGKPVLVMRDVTERPEAISAGTVKLVGTDPHRIVTAVEAVLLDDRIYQRMATAINPYGDGHAAQRIVRIIKNSIAEPQVPARELSYGK